MTQNEAFSFYLPYRKETRFDGYLITDLKKEIWALPKVYFVLNQTFMLN
jgi:hypothetical protein